MKITDEFCRRSTQFVRFRQIGDEPIRHCRRVVLVGVIADRARRARAAAGVWAFPRPVATVFADPSTVIAASAELHAEELPITMVVCILT
jgi:hypothetical protein